MPAYLIAHVEISDPERHSNYTAARALRAGAAKAEFVVLEGYQPV